MRKLAVFVSGRGSNLAAMLAYGLTPELVLADRPAAALDIADDYAVRTALIDRAEFGFTGPHAPWDRTGFTIRLVNRLYQSDIELVAMAGFMTVLDPVVFDHFGGRIINLHPSLLPRYPGAHAIRDALEDGAAETGVTIHLATHILDDHTYVLAQAKVPIHRTDTLRTLKARIQQVEHELYPKTLTDIVAGRRQLPPVA